MTASRAKASASAAVSASGLRPAAAFAAIAVVLLAVGFKAARIALVRQGSQPSARERIVAPLPEFEITDRRGRPLALSVECFDLSLSPQAMWRSHTPLRLAQRLIEVLEPERAGAEQERALLELLARMLPAEALEGEVVTRSDGLLVFDAERAARVAGWIETGRLAARPAGGTPSGAPFAAGMRLVPLADSGPWVLAWSPVVTLDESTRRAAMRGDAWKRPAEWTRRLLGDLAELVDPRRLSDELAGRLAVMAPGARREELREGIWQELMPSQYRRVASRVDPDSAHVLTALLQAEAVSPWQMRLDPSLDRRHPVRADDGAPAADAFAVLGDWGVLAPEAAQERARREAGLRPGEGYLNELQRRFVLDRSVALATEWHALSGLELVCDRLFASGRYDFLEERERLYERRLRSVPRDRRREWPERVPNYYESALCASPVPRAVSTLDAPLQRFVHAELERVMSSLDPALAMALVVEVESGDVLAVDSTARYPLGGFAPIHHAFTPGSTFKAIVMSLALDLGLVRPEERFETFAPLGIVVRDADGGGRGRLIREAEGSPTEDWIDAAEGLAQSVNAVLVQIGLRVPPPVLRDRILALGYGLAPESGLGPERAGYVARLTQGTWKRRFTHASVAIGHEVLVTAWQHATALATLARGGRFRPLRTVAAVECEERRWDVPLAPTRRVIGESAAAELREMLRMGAVEGTGEPVAGPDRCPEFHRPGATIGTKTGTTEKVETESCLHVELAHNATLHADGGPCERACRDGLKFQRDHRGRRQTCYTSSMVALGRPTPDVPELLVLVVVEDARSRLKFGAEVAGPSAIAILRAAHGLEPWPLGPPSSAAGSASGPAPSADPLAARSEASGTGMFNARDFPWAEAGGDSR